MVESTAVPCIQSSHPDKNNNSVVRIISKEEEREDPRRDSSIYLRVQWCFHISTRTTVILQELQDSFEYSVFLQELQCFYTAESSHKAPTAFQGHTAQAGFQ